MPSSSLLLGVGAVLSTLTSTTLATKYNLEQTYTGNNWLDAFHFETYDLNNGFVNYVDEATAKSSQLYKTVGSDVVFGVDSTEALKVTDKGRKSVRLEGNEDYNHGLFIIDIKAMPSMCGLWPAFWALGREPWPVKGEIDIIEGVNDNHVNKMVLHTNTSCKVNGQGQTGTQIATDCALDGPNGASGCDVNDARTTSFGAGFNSNGGGVYAMEWSSAAIKTWFFPRGTALPASLSKGSPDTTDFGEPAANFQGDCNIDQRFKDQRFIFTNNFCGDWAGNVYSQSSCPQYTGLSSMDSCKKFVAENPKAFSNAFWRIASFKTYTAKAVVSSSSSSSVSRTSTRVSSSSPTKVSSSSSSHKASSSSSSAKVTSSSSSAKVSSSSSSLKPTSSSSSHKASSSSSAKVSSSSSYKASSSVASSSSIKSSSSIHATSSAPVSSSSKVSSSSAHVSSSSYVASSIHSSSSVYVASSASSSSSYVVHVSSSVSSSSVVHPSGSSSVVYSAGYPAGSSSVPVYSVSSLRPIYIDAYSTRGTPAASTPCTTSSVKPYQSSAYPVYPASSSAAYPVYPVYPLNATSPAPVYPVYPASSTPVYPVYPASSAPVYPVYPEGVSSAPGYGAYPSKSVADDYPYLPDFTPVTPLYPEVTSKPVYGNGYDSYPEVSKTTVTTTYTYVDVCETGYTTITTTHVVTYTPLASPTPGSGYPVYPPPVYEVTTKVCNYGCGQGPTTVTVTIPAYPTAQKTTPVPAYPTAPSYPVNGESTLVITSKVYATKVITLSKVPVAASEYYAQKPASSAVVLPVYSKPAAPLYSAEYSAAQPSKPVATPVKPNGGYPAGNGTGVYGTGVYGTGVTKPTASQTGYKVPQFTGAASGLQVGGGFVAAAVAVAALVL